MIKEDVLQAGFGGGKIRFSSKLFPVEGFIGVHDEPGARLMVLQSGKVRMAVVSLELVMLSEDGVQRCRRIVEECTGVPAPHVWVHVTHAISTMHEPGPMGPPDRRPQPTEREWEQKKLYFEAVETALWEAAVQAAEDFGPVKFGWGSGSCNVNVNRDVETPFGWWTGQNPDALSNKRMSVLKAEDLSGTPKGFLISYGIKPGAIDNAGMETKDRLLSADVCGVCSRRMEEAFGAPALFCVSAAGDQVPAEQAWWEEAVGENRSVPRDLGVKKGLEIAARLGRTMGEDAVSIAKSIACTQTKAKIRHETFSFSWSTRRGREKAPGLSVLSYPAEGERKVEAEIFTLGDAAFVAEKPEINCRTEQELLARSPFAHTCLVCMVNGGMKYMPDRLAYERGTFEAQSSMLLPGAAERFVEEAVACLQKLYEEEGTDDERA